MRRVGLLLTLLWLGSALAATRPPLVGVTSVPSGACNTSEIWVVFATGAGYQCVAGTWGAAFTPALSPVSAAAGGTGLTTYAVGDLIYASATTPTLSRLADVAAGSWLRSGGIGVAPGYSTPTIPNATTTGDIWYGSATSTMTALAGNTAGKLLRTGGASTAPAWSTTVWTNSANTGDLLYASASNTYANLADVAAGSWLRSGGASTAPAWSTPTLPNAAGTAGKVLISDGTNFVTSTPTYPNASATSGKYIRSDGTNFIASTGSASGTGACSANRWAGTLNSDAAPTCTGMTTTLSVDHNIDTPTTADTNKLQSYFPSTATIVRIVCSTDTGTVSINFDERAETTPNTAGTNTLSSALVCDTDSQITTTFSDSSIATRVPYNLQITATSGTPTIVRIHVEYTVAE